METATTAQLADSRVDELAAEWKDRITIARLKRGRSLNTAILHVAGDIEPPLEALFLAVGEWKTASAGQVVRRPNEGGMQVYWLNAVNQF